MFDAAAALQRPCPPDAGHRNWLCLASQMLIFRPKSRKLALFGATTPRAAWAAPIDPAAELALFGAPGSPGDDAPGTAANWLCLAQHCPKSLRFQIINNPSSIINAEASSARIGFVWRTRVHHRRSGMRVYCEGAGHPAPSTHGPAGFPGFRRLAKRLR